MFARAVETKGSLLLGGSGRIYGAYANDEQVVVRGLDPSGDVRWTEEVHRQSHRRYGGRPVVVHGDDLVVVDGRKLIRIDPSGTWVDRVLLPIHAGESADAFARVPEGWVVAVTRGRQGKRSRRVLRIDEIGTELWSTELPGAPKMGTGREVRSWIVGHHGPLITSDRVLVQFTDMPSSGIGQWYGVELSDGTHRWTSEMAPWGRAAASGGRILLGSQGYGAFDTWELAEHWTLTDHWASHGLYLFEPDGIRVVELENRTPSESVLCCLQPGGVRVTGDQLAGYYTSDAHLLPDGRAAFWRHGVVWIADGLSLEKLVDVGHPDKTYVGGSVLTDSELILLLQRNHDDGGSLAFTQQWVRVPIPTG